MVTNSWLCPALLSIASTAVLALFQQHMLAVLLVLLPPTSVPLLLILHACLFARLPERPPACPPACPCKTTRSSQPPPATCTCLHQRSCCCRHCSQHPSCVRVSRLAACCAGPRGHLLASPLLLLLLLLLTFSLPLIYVFSCLPACLPLQDHAVITAIASYFQHPIPEVAWNNEDQFISVLNKAGLTDQTA